MTAQGETIQAPARQASGGSLRGVRVVNLRRALLLAAGLYLLYAFASAVVRVLLLFFLAFLVAAVLNGPVRRLAARGVPRGLSAAVIALLVLGCLGAAVYFGGPPLANQAAAVVQSGPQRLQRLQQRVETLARKYPALQPVVTGSNDNSINLRSRVASFLPRLGRYGLKLLGDLGAALVVLVVALYLLASPQPLLRGGLAAVSPRYREQTARALARILQQMESWALATLALMVIVGTATGLGLWALGVSNPLLFGLIAGLGEAIPTVGPIVSALPPMAVALADAPIKALWVALLFLGVQQAENNLLVPLIMGRGVKLHPVSILFFVLTLGALLGLLGALIAVPTAIVTKVVWEEFSRNTREADGDALDQETARIFQAETDCG